MVMDFHAFGAALRVGLGSTSRPGMTVRVPVEPLSRFATCIGMNPDLQGLKDKALAIHGRLCEVYECPIPYFHSLDPLSELISSLLSHRTRNADSGRAFRALRTRYADWRAMINAPTEEVEEIIEGVTWPEQKAPRLQAVLRAIEKRHGDLSLDFLGAMPVEEARAWLESIPGIGPKTSAAVLSFSMLRKAALPVDSHHHRVAQRTGLIPQSTAVGPSHAALAALLPENWNAQQVYDHHEVMMLHGQRCCFFKSPACGRCAILDLCPTGQGRMEGRQVPAMQPENVMQDQSSRSRER